MLTSDEYCIPVDVQNEIDHKKEAASNFRKPLPTISMRWIQLVPASSIINLMRTLSSMAFSAFSKQTRGARERAELTNK